MTSAETQLLDLFRKLDDGQRGVLTIAAAGVKIRQEAERPRRFRTKPTNLERLKRAHVCSKDPEAGFRQLPPAGDVRQWKCLGCGAAVIL